MKSKQILPLQKFVGMNSDKEKQLKELLDNHHDWPDTFMFKFIYKSDQNTESILRALFPKNAEFTIKSSTKNNFNSMTVNHLANDSEEVFSIYRAAAKIEGVISL